MILQMEQQFTEAKEQALQQVETNIGSLFEGKQTVDFRFDAFSLWNASDASKAFWKDFPAKLDTDDWNRAVWSLSKDRAMEIAKYVESWNADWEYAIASKVYGGNPMEYYNAYQVAFGPATGTEHEIPVNAGTYKATTSWQWS